jgi:hypothetical protein
MALEHIWAIITHIVHNIPSSSSNPSPSNSNKHLNIRTKIVSQHKGGYASSNFGPHTCGSKPLGIIN